MNPKNHKDIQLSDIPMDEPGMEKLLNGARFLFSKPHQDEIPKTSTPTAQKNTDQKIGVAAVKNNQR